jgi:23S rRNA pseudouridine955/2504/2580 synthase
MKEITITVADHCRPVGSWLRMQLPSATTGYLNQLLKKAHITVNGKPVSDLTTLAAGDLVVLKESGRTRSLLSGAVPGLDILFEDRWVVCFNKPPQMPMHHAAEVGPENLVDLGAAFLHARERAAHPHAAEPTFKLRPVNRLDRGTSGAVLLAKSSTAAGIFGKMVMENGLDKLYLAIVSGRIEGSGEITAPVEEKEALTRYRLLAAAPECSLVALWPQTGRMHQLRQHMRSIGHPIIGDRRYGGRPLPMYPGFMLHAFRTRFIHPETAQDVVIHAPLPAGFLEMIRKIAGSGFPETIAGLSDLEQN